MTECTHDWEPIDSPLTGRHRCTKCGVLGWRRQPLRRNWRSTPRNKMRILKCNVQVKHGIQLCNTNCGKPAVRETVGGQRWCADHDV